jgi:hypothetical protein
MSRQQLAVAVLHGVRNNTLLLLHCTGGGAFQQDGDVAKPGFVRSSV